MRHVDDDLKMPPAGKLAEREIASLEKWVELGLPWPDKVTLAAPDAITRAAAKHWAFKPVVRPALPKGSAANPIDRFVVARLNESRLSLSARANRRTLIRRATFDLHGLPPTPEEIDRDVRCDMPLVQADIPHPRDSRQGDRVRLALSKGVRPVHEVDGELVTFPWA